MRKCRIPCTLGDRGRRFGRTDHGSRMAPSAAQSHATTPSTTRGQECGCTWARTRRSATLSCTPFTLLCSRVSKNSETRRSPSSQTPRQPYRGLHPTHQAQDSDTLSQLHNRRTTYGSNEESQSNSGGPPAMQAPPATRRPTSGKRWQHGTSAAQSNCFTSSAARP